MPKSADNNEGKINGLIVDYCGILKNLRKALATFTGKADEVLTRFRHRGGQSGSTDCLPKITITSADGKVALSKSMEYG